jgi:isopentenyl phosphate kinase
MIILKLGGSVITDKSKPFSIRKNVLKRLAREIKEAEKELVVVHGGGSYGHPLASAYQLQEGLREPGQIIGIAKTRLAMENLNRNVVKSFIGAGLPAVSIQSSAIFECKNGRITNGRADVITDFLNLEMMPVLYGDVAIDRAIKFCILSGDQIVSYLARHLSPERVILATDVDGVLNQEGKLIELMNQDNASAILSEVSSAKSDVTGGMRGKVSELLELSGTGIQSLVINALEKGRVKNALLGKRVKGTLFEAEK